MPELPLQIQGLGPLLFGDGRPFTADAGLSRAATLRLPLPGTVAGFLRTRVGDALGYQWNRSNADEVRKIAVRGPLLRIRNRWVFPAPADALVFEADENGAVTVSPLRPRRLESGVGCDLPRGLYPIQLDQNQKPARGYALWSGDDMTRWLAQDGAGAPPEKLEGLAVEERVHVGINPLTGLAEDGRLFVTEGLVFGADDYIVVTVDAPAQASATTALSNLSGIGTLGGERRVASVAAGNWFDCPEPLKKSISQAKGLRLVLATPALFRDGWRPGWLNEDLQGSPPGLDGLRLRLSAACVPRRQPVSGWDYLEKGQKPVRWLAPAGSVYFFEVLDGSPAVAADQGWLAPVSDNEQDRKDGYGLALWGVWKGLPG